MKILPGVGDGRLDGLAGDDVLDGGPGNDTLSGGAGSDTLVGGADAAQLKTGSGQSATASTSVLAGNDTVAAGRRGQRHDGGQAGLQRGRARRRRNWSAWRSTRQRSAKPAPGNTRTRAGVAGGTACRSLS